MPDKKSAPPCYSIFRNGVDRVTELDAAIPPKPGPPGHAVFACLGWKEWPHIADLTRPQYYEKCLSNKARPIYFLVATKFATSSVKPPPGQTPSLETICFLVDTMGTAAVTW